MPTPSSAIAAIAEALGGADPQDEDAVSRFYTDVFPTFTDGCREMIFDWLVATDHEPGKDEVEAFVGAFEKRDDSHIRLEQNVFYANGNLSDNEASNTAQAMEI